MGPADSDLPPQIALSKLLEGEAWGSTVDVVKTWKCMASCRMEHATAWYLFLLCEDFESRWENSKLSWLPYSVPMKTLVCGEQRRGCKQC